MQYTLEGELGRGGFGIVSKAKGEDLNYYAIKKLILCLRQNPKFLVSDDPEAI
jgi:hypothetical protein